MAFTLNGWKLTTSTLLISKLPSQTYDSSVVLIDNYLSDVGGWVADAGQPSTGDGEPANGATPDTAVSEILLDQSAHVYRLSANMTLNLKLEYVANLSAGLSDSDVIDQMSAGITEFIQNQLDSSPMNFVTISAITGPVTNGAYLDSTQRISIQSAIVNNNYQSDPRAAAMAAAQNLYALDSTWSIDAYYIATDHPIIVSIKKYTSDQYIDIDPTAGHQYIISISHTDYKVVGGIAISLT